MKGVLLGITLCLSDLLVICLSTCAHLLFSKENMGVLSPVIENISLNNQFSPRGIIIFGLLACSVPQLLGSQTSSSPVPRHIVSGIHPALCPSLRVNRAAGPRSAAACYQRLCWRGRIQRHSSPCWTTFPRLSQPGFVVVCLGLQFKIEDIEQN